MYIWYNFRMKRIVIFLVGLYLASALGIWALLSKNTKTNEELSRELATTKNELAATKDALETEKASLEVLEKKIAETRVNATFLSLALCPTLEATDKEALCIKNSTEWLSQTILSGTALTSPEAKTKMEALLIALGAKKKPTAKQLYEMLKPIEIDSLKVLVENLK